MLTLNFLMSSCSLLVAFKEPRKKTYYPLSIVNNLLNMCAVSLFFQNHTQVPQKIRIEFALSLEGSIVSSTSSEHSPTEELVPVTVQPHH